MQVRLHPDFRFSLKHGQPFGHAWGFREMRDVLFRVLTLRVVASLGLHIYPPVYGTFLEVPTIRMNILGFMETSTA